MQQRFGRSLATLAVLALALGGCGQKEAASNDDTKRALDQMVAAQRDTLAATKDAAATSHDLLDELRKVTARLDAVEKTVRDAAANQKRAAIHLQLETETVCDNDASCSDTARAVCNRINYPKAITAKYTPGTRPTLQSVVCFD